MAACVAACAAKEFVAGVREWRGESAVRWSRDGKAPAAVALLARGEGIGRRKRGRIVVKYSGDKLIVGGRRSSGITRAQMQLDELGNEVERDEEGQLWSPSPDASKASDSSKSENGAPLGADNSVIEVVTNGSTENSAVKVSSRVAGGSSNGEAAVFWNESTLSNESCSSNGSSNGGMNGPSRAPTNGAARATVDAIKDVKAVSKVKMIKEEDPWFKKAASSNSKVSVSPGGRWNKFKTYSTIQRSLEIWGFVITFLFKWWVNNQKFMYKGGMTELKKRQKRKVLARWLKEGLLRLGPTFIKIGQQFSTRVDILAKEYVDELAELQDQVPPFTSDTAVQIIEEELGRPVDLIFDQFDRDPIAAASLGQVYRAKLRGREVVVKVQRPGLKSLFDIDLKNLRVIAQNLQNIDPKSDGAKRDWVAIYDECANVLYEEIDYTKEATNAERFAFNFRDMPYVKVPSIYREFSTPQVLVMEYVPGIKINQIAGLDELGVDRKRLARYAVESYLEQILRHGFFHADPHPGNIAVDDTNGGRLIFYDFGMMGSISPNIREGLLEVFYGVYEKDPDKVLAAMVQMGVLVPSSDLTAVRRTVLFFLNSFEERLVAQRAEKERVKAEATKLSFKKRLTKEEKSEKKKMRLAAIGEDLLSIGADQPFRFPASFTFVVRAFSVLDGIGKGLDTRFDISEIAKPYALELLRFREAGVEVIFKDLRKRWDRQSQAFANVFKQADRVEKISSIIQRLAILAATCLQLATMLHLSAVGMPATAAFMASALFVSRRSLES